MTGKRLAKSKTELYARDVARVSKLKRKPTQTGSRLLVPSGSTLLNLACSDTHYGAYPIGKIINPIGDKSTGKTYFALTSLAEAAVSPDFKDYRFIMDDAEVANEFNIKKLFGKALNNRIELNIISKTIEDFYGNLMRAVKEGSPFIYILDSLDSVTSVAEQKRAGEYAKGKEPDGSYKTEKPKLVSELLRVITGDIKDKEALVIIISQTRDNIGFGAMFKPKVRTGGKALEFYASHEMWHAVKQREKSKGREIGMIIETRVTKNKLTGKRRVIETPIYPDSYGLDSITGNVNFLLSEKYWDMKGNKISATEFDLCTMKKRLVKEIEGRSLEHELDLIVASVWKQIEDSITPERKPKFER